MAKGLTIGLMLGKKPPMRGEGGDDYEESPDSKEMTEDESEEEMPEGLLDAVQEMRVALEQGDDEEAAKALMNAITCCRG